MYLENQMHQFNVTKKELRSFSYDGEELELQISPCDRFWRIGFLGVRGSNYFVGYYDGKRKWVDRPILSKGEIERRLQVIDEAIKFLEENGVISKLPILIR